MKRGRLALALAVALTACGQPASKSDAEPTPRPTATATAVPTVADDTEPACTSYEGLDVASLPPLPEGQYVPVMDEVWRRVLDKYYEPTIGCLDWPAVRVEFAAKVAAAPTQADAYRAMNEMLGRLQQSHFILHSPGPSDEDAHGPASPELSVRYIEERLIVVHSNEPGVAAGSALVAVDGRGTDALIERAKAKSKRPAELAFHAARSASAWLSCFEAGETHAVTLEHASGQIVDAKVACKAPPGELVTLGNLSNIPTVVQHRSIDGTSIGVVAFNVWMLPMVPRIRSALTELTEGGMKALVLDLRGNPGGVGLMATTVGRFLVTEETSLGALQYRKFVQNFKVVPDAAPFGGPIAVLVDEGTASTSEIFAAGLRDAGRITVVGGGPSAGAALPSIIEELQGGAVLQYAVGDYHSPKGTVVEGKGVVPDIEVKERREHFVAGADPVLDAAVAHLQTRLDAD